MASGDQFIFTSWGKSCLGSPLLDLELLLFSSSSCLKQLGSDQSMAPWQNLSVKVLREEFERYKLTAFLQTIVVLMTNIKALEAKFESDPNNDSTGRKLRQVAGRAVELADEAVLNNWRRKCQVETSSL